MIVSVTMFFLLCNICSLVLHLWETVEPKLFYKQSTKAFLLLDLSNISILMNTCLNFVIYLAYSKKYRQRFKFGLVCLVVSDRSNEQTAYRMNRHLTAAASTRQSSRMGVEPLKNTVRFSSVPVNRRGLRFSIGSFKLESTTAV